jgi:hypothetical protein
LVKRNPGDVYAAWQHGDGIAEPHKALGDRVFA